MTELSDRERRQREEKRPTEDVIAAALAKNIDTDGAEYRELICILQRRIPAIFGRLEALAISDDPSCREMVAMVLGQNGQREKVSVDECVDRLITMLHREESPNVLASIIYAMGHLEKPTCLPFLLKFENHPDADVRYALAHALGGFQEDTALEVLCHLSFDADVDIRNWATFGIGSLSSRRNDLIRNALIVRLTDENDEVRGEALVGLAERCDVCVVPSFLRELEKHPPEVSRQWLLIQDAAAAVEKCNSDHPQPEWQPLLAKLKELGISGKAQEK